MLLLTGEKNSQEVTCITFKCVVEQVYQQETKQERWRERERASKQATTTVTKLVFQHSGNKISQEVALHTPKCH